MEEEKRYTDKEQNAGYHTFFRQPKMNRGPFKRKTFLLKVLSFRKICPYPSAISYSNCHQALIGRMRSKAHTARTRPLVLYRIRIHKCAMKNFCINGQMRNKLFLIIIYRFSLVKAAVNAACVCKLCNGVSKTPQFLPFSIAKGGKRQKHTCKLRRGGVFEAQIGAFTNVN